MLVRPAHAYERLQDIRNAQAQEVHERVRDINPPNRRRLEQDSPLLRDDAVRVDIQRRRPSEALPELPSAGSPEVSFEATPVIGEVTPVERPQSLFQSDKIIKGSYGDGKFSTASGEQGTYYGLPNGQVGFEIDGFKGVMMNAHTAVVYNKETGEAYSMNVRYDANEFSMGNIKEVKGQRLKYVQDLLA